MKSVLIHAVVQPSMRIKEVKKEKIPAMMIKPHHTTITNFTMMSSHGPSVNSIDENYR